MTVHDVWGLAGSVLLVCNLALRIPFLRHASLRSRFLTALLTAACLLIPLLSGVMPAAYLRGVIGDLSAVSLFLLLLALQPRFSCDTAELRLLHVLAVAGGLLLYPLTLGPFRIDPYQWGYQPAWLIASVALIAGAAGIRHWLVPLALTLALSAYALQLGASPNLWDYLLDPWLFIYALICLWQGRLSGSTKAASIGEP